MSALKIESFCVEPSEKWMFAGDASGQIYSIDIDRFSVVDQVQAHVGIIQAMAAHRTLPYLAALSTDRTVSVWARNGRRLSPICVIPLRGIRPSNDREPVPFVHSTSQALGFHDSKPRIVTRSGNAGVVELQFDENGRYDVRWCVRLHGEADLISARYVKESDRILSGSIDGQFILSEGGEELRRWQIGKSGNVHWAEHLSGDVYLLASDMRAVVRVDISGRDSAVVGERFTLDDLEHVTYNRTSQKAYVASFDRNIYEVDINSCSPKRVVYRPPFKCRWLKTLERSPSTLLVQCRNGGLYKADADTGECLGVIKRTPEALWTASHLLDGSIALAGEGERLLRLAPAGTDPHSRASKFEPKCIPLNITPGSYTKRMALQESTGRLVLGRTNGEIVVINTGPSCDMSGARRLLTLGSAVRDLAVVPEGSALFAACEDGSVHRLDLDSGETLLSWHSPAGQPIWSLAHCPERAILAASERSGMMVILDDADFKPILTGIETARPKRMKFVGSESLLYNKLDQLFRLDLRTTRVSLLVDSQGNTIEDFLWDSNQRYLLLSGYTQNLALCDFHSGEVINVVPDQIDYSKGLIWVDRHDDPNHYPLDFLTFGRSGTAHYFRIHDEKILALGPVCEVIQ